MVVAAKRKRARIDPETGDTPIMLMKWAAPDYGAIFKYRMERLDDIRNHPEDLPAIKAYYALHPADFINDWGVTFDPRNAEIGLPTLMPFILFKKQRDWVDWVLGQWMSRSPGLCEKSRDMGVSWLAMSLSCTLCIFRDGISIGVGSRKGEYVDKIGTHKPLLPKARMFMENLPVEFRGGYEAWRDAPFMRISIPETGSMIGGEGGDDIGRGDRAQPLDARILTPSGWRPMGDLAVGEHVIGADGRPTRVIGVYPQGVKQVFRVTFGDGSSTECCGEHLWHVTTRASRKTKRAKNPRAPRFYVRQLDEIARSLSANRSDDQTEYEYQIPLMSLPALFDAQVQPLHPYLVGALIGDGSYSAMSISPSFTTADAEMVERVQGVLPEHCRIVSDGSPYGYRLIDERGHRGRGHRSPLKAALRDLGMAGVKGTNKSVPKPYLLGTPTERLAVLRGLLDTDGWARERRGSPQIGFVTISPQLHEDVRFLVQSLGGTTSSSIIKPNLRRFPGGKMRQCKQAYCLTISMPHDINPFSLTRKASRWKARDTYAPRRSIVSVQPAGFKQTQCIRVEAADHLYVTDDCIVTHNTAIYFVDEYAHFERPELTEASLSQTTNCRIDMSSVRGMNNPFARKRWEGKVNVFIFDWHDDPRKSDEWYAKQQADLDPVVVAQEIDRDYSASVTGIVIPGAWVRAAIDAREKLGIAPAGRKGMSLDIADEGIDKNAICLSQGIEILTTDEWSGKGGDIYQTVVRGFEICDEHDLSSFEYDADGIGASVRGDARTINEQRQHAGRRIIRAVSYRGSSKVYDPEGIVEGTKGREGDKGVTNEDYFFNRKAQSWFHLRKLFRNTYRWVVEKIECDPNEIISISSACPGYLKLVAELSQPTFKPGPRGKIIVNKTPANTKSPNRADAVMMRFAPNETPPLNITTELISQVMLAGMDPRRRR